MKIVAHTPTELIIRDSALVPRAVGAFLALIGAFAIFIGLTQDPDGRVGVTPIVVGSFIVLGGALLMVLPRRKTFAFSRAERVFIIAKERFGRVEREVIPLDRVSDVTVEESSGDDGNTYRIALTLADQRRIPFTSYYTSGFASKQAIAELMREFLRMEPSPALGSGAPTVKSEHDLRRGRIGLYVMGAFCTLFLGIGATMLAKEQRRLSVFRPVPATVLSTRVQEHSDSDGSTYEPVVVYRYRVEDREYTASRVTPLKESRSGRWARRVTARYAVGTEYTAYYDPDNPAEAFLLRSRSFLPWAFVGIPLIGLLLIGAGIRGSRELTRASYRARSFG
jgi:uncharacterized protein DUF3592